MPPTRQEQSDRDLGRRALIEHGHALGTATCRSCGDPIELADRLKTAGYCRECFEELKHGVIPKVIDPTMQAHSKHLTPRQAAKLGKTTGG